MGELLKGSGRARAGGSKSSRPRQADIETQEQISPGEVSLEGRANSTSGTNRGLDEPRANVASDTERDVFSGSNPLVGTRYQVLDELGRGGMGTVYLATHLDLGRPFAVKVLSRRMSSDAVVVERMRREAQTASKLRHPGIVDVTDFGETADGLVYIVMELLEGQSVAQRLESEGRFGQEEALTLVRDASVALAAAHSQGVIHRDIKPENIVIDRSGEGEVVKLVDFGIALSSEHEDQRLTQVNTLPGTPVYMAPEQAAKRESTELSDQYAMGVVLYELLAGSPPFHGPTGVETLAAKITEDPPPFELRAPDAEIHPAVEALVFRALSRDPSARFVDMAAFAAAIEDVLREVRSGRGLLPHGHSRRRRALPLVLGLVVLVGVALGSGVFVVRSLRSAAESSPPLEQEVRGASIATPIADAAPADITAQGAARPATDAEPGLDAAADASADSMEGVSDGGEGRGDAGNGASQRRARRAEGFKLIAEGERLLRARRLGDARRAFSKGLQAAPGHPAGLAGLGRVAFEQSRYGEATRFLEQAVRRRPGNVGYRIALGSAYLRRGRRRQAIEQWERVLQQSPNNRAAKRMLQSVER